MFVNNIFCAYYHFISAYAIILFEGGRIMIINRLSVLLAERGLSGAKFAISTKIAQSTISKITSQKSKQIDYKTLNTICNSLSIEPKDFFEYSPYDFEFSYALEQNKYSVFVSTSEYGKNSNIYEYDFSFRFTCNNNTESDFDYENIILNKFQVNHLSIHYDLNLKEETISEFEKLSVPLKTNFLEELEIFLTPLLNEIFSTHFANDFEVIQAFNIFKLFNSNDTIQLLDGVYSVSVNPTDSVEDFSF